jgi:hypothetical protein
MGVRSILGLMGSQAKSLEYRRRPHLARSDCLAGSRQEEPSTKDENLKAFMAHDQRKFQCSNVSCLDDCETFEHVGSANDHPVAYIHPTISGLQRIHDHSHTSFIFNKIIYFISLKRPLNCNRIDMGLTPPPPIHLRSARVSSDAVTTCLIEVTAWALGSHFHLQHLGESASTPLFRSHNGFANHTSGE